MAKTTYVYDDLIEVQSIISNAVEENLKPYLQQSTASLKEDGSIVTNADIAMQDALAKALGESFPEVTMVSEELSEQEQAKAMQSGHNYWCLDPIDGTTNFHATMPLFSISLALVSNGQIAMATVYDPVREEFFSAIKDEGFWINGEIINRPNQPEALTRSIALIDFKRLPIDLRKALVDRSPYKSQRNIGTCALEWAWLAAGRAQLLIHGSEKLWDYAAGSLLLTEAGGCSQTLDGEDVFIESLETRSVVAASNTNLYQQWSNWIKEF